MVQPAVWERPPTRELQLTVCMCSSCAERDSETVQYVPLLSGVAESHPDILSTYLRSAWDCYGSTVCLCMGGCMRDRER